MTLWPPPALALQRARHGARPGGVPEVVAPAQWSQATQIDGIQARRAARLDPIEALPHE